MARDSTASTVKEIVLELVKNLPDDCSWDEVMYRLYVRQKLEAGMQDIQAGKVIPHDEVFQEFDE